MRTFAQQQKPPQEMPAPNRARTSSAEPDTRLVQTILHLQRTLGNRAVQRLLRANADALGVGSAAAATTRPAHDLSGSSVSAQSPTGVQTKLTVNAPGDAYEQEADRVADRVMRTPAPQLQRACDCDGSCPKCQSRQPGQEHEHVQTKRAESGEATAPPVVQEVVASTGQPLDPATRAFMEPRFGHDFSEVQVHTDAKAAESARSVNALAYTTGSHMVFGAGMYAPATDHGRQLLAHELAHVVQQGGNNAGIQRMLACPSTLSGPTPPGWKSYQGDPSVFHCGYRGILEDRVPTSDDPQNECFYDPDGRLVDENHPFSGCRGTPNQYDSNANPVLHALWDSGGILFAGAPAFADSRAHDVGSFLVNLENQIRRLYGVP